MLNDRAESLSLMSKKQSYFRRKELVHLWIFLLCAGIVFLIQFIILQPVIQYRLIDIQDWRYLLMYRSLDPNPFYQLINFWINMGLHETPAIYHTGILSEFFGFNYQAYQIANILFKTVATLSLFPLILIIFKNKWLAFLSTIFYGINSATAGPLQVVDTGAEYLALAAFNIFLITYYYTISKKNEQSSSSKKIFYFLSSLFFLFAYLLYPPRMFPQLLLVPLVEIYWLLTSRKLKNIKFSIIRTLIYIVPVILISLPAPVSPGFPHAKQPLILLQEILNGNWHNLLDPFAGIGWTLVTNDFWKFFGTLELETLKNFKEYLNFLFSGPVLIFGGITLILSLILSSKPRKFFLLVFGLNFIVEILVFFIANDNYRIFESILKTDNLGQFIIIRDPNVAALDAPTHFLFTKYPALLGIYILIVAFVTFFEWIKDKKNNLLLAVWVGPVFSVIFHFPGWVVQGHLINDYSSIHRYYLVPAVGISLFLAAIIAIFYEKFKRNILLKTFALLIISVIFFTLFKVNKSEIEREFLGLNPERVKPADQQKLHDSFMNKFGASLGNGDVLFYFDLSSKNLGKNKEYYKEALVVSDIGNWIKLRRKNLMFTCMGAFTDFLSLKDSVKKVNEQINFVFPGQCDAQDGKIGIRRSNKLHFYKLENLRAFRVENGEFIDIKIELLKELSL